MGSFMPRRRRLAVSQDAHPEMSAALATVYHRKSIAFLVSGIWPDQAIIALKGQVGPQKALGCAFVSNLLHAAFPSS
jgi:hypothetical protein